MKFSEDLIPKFKPGQIFSQFNKDINSIDFDDEGKYMVVGANDGSLSLYDLEKG